MIGDRLRVVRNSQQRSLSDVAEKAQISVATLSRIETNKQPLEVGLLLAIARILKVPAHELLSDGANGIDENDSNLAAKIASLAGPQRANLWRKLAEERRNAQMSSRHASAADVSQKVEELVAQIDYMREEIEQVRKRMNPRSRRR